MSFCINHTDRAATTRCSSCHKPICAECVVASGGAVFCSQRCAEGAARFYARYQGIPPTSIFTKLKNLVLSLIGLAIILGMILAFCAYVLKVPFCADLVKKLTGG